MTTTLNPTITITVSGPTGSGKSRVLALTEDALRLCLGNNIIIDSPELASERGSMPDDYASWHSPRSGTIFKLEEINQPINSTPAGTDTHTDGRSRHDQCTISENGNPLAGIEARLTQEVKDLADALGRFSVGTRRISAELPDNSQFGKLIMRFFSDGSLQLANALLKGRDKPLLLDDGTLQLQELGLSLNDFIREISLDGRRFLAIALVDNHVDQEK
ncbi:TPA: hypothetical protein ACIVB1_001949 [Salmonella enterica subsp. diarizonae serovar 61:l,v:z35]